MGENYLVIPDLHEPACDSRALSHCKALKKEYNTGDNTIFLGDEVDVYWGSTHDKDPDAKWTANEEIELAREKLREWGSAFPKARVCTSNHGLRWLRRMFDYSLPSQLLRSYEEIYQVPKGWKYQEKWVIKQKYPWMAFHGEGFSGINAHRTAAMAFGMSVVHGHLHTSAAISFLKTHGLDIWAANFACLIDVEAFCFRYSKIFKFQPTLGAGVITQDGRTPLWIPL